MLLRILPQIALVLTLLFAQLGGLTHGVSHTHPAPRNDQSQPLSDVHCDLCDEYAQIGNVLHGRSFVPPLLVQVAHPLPLTTQQTLRESFTAFAARAPPATDTHALR